ncbi:uncharacterized protein BO88DRAFT_175910 [Aspergillus vadensis CBS 113365]|uniref:Uncharacterized protein n=1 Tax=Aspergillus vadensis (strain CBS 113365 / IMI 142717 / IBT 24658) TaxID=1448311 RepID=A0A319BL10_ASPVC|nr:hypothetical protein BO88DRAFT_175910 [Aspergillus vadensis CBS 113365]PYH73041.1 hypothetical protein BO88DRAFT_175910 [Aspergillus vadensis CBS 113365]
MVITPDYLHCSFEIFPTPCSHVSAASPEEKRDLTINYPIVIMKKNIGIAEGRPLEPQFRRRNETLLAKDPPTGVNFSQPWLMDAAAATPPSVFYIARYISRLDQTTIACDAPVASNHDDPCKVHLCFSLSIIPKTGRRYDLRGLSRSIRSDTPWSPSSPTASGRCCIPPFKVFLSTPGRDDRDPVPLKSFLGLFSQFPTQS